MLMEKSSRGFSLVELSIVLVVLGLLVGGVLSGQSLIRAAQLRSIPADYQRYATAINSFRDKYFALPGDMSNANAFWGKDNAACSSQQGTIATPGTCNGDADGFIEYPTAPGQTGEAFRGWQHMALAGLIEGSYTGNAGPSYASQHILGTNSPRSKFSNVGFSLLFDDYSITSYPWVFARDYRQWMQMGANDNQQLDNEFLSPEEAWNVDTKIDDGKPAQGKVNVTGSPAVTNCTTASGSTDFNGEYRLNDRSIACALLFSLR